MNNIYLITNESVSSEFTYESILVAAPYLTRAFDMARKFVQSADHSTEPYIQGDWNQAELKGTLTSSKIGITHTVTGVLTCTWVKNPKIKSNE